MKILNLDALPLLKGYLKEYNYLGNIAFRFTKGFTPFFLILHFANDSPFTA